MAFEYQRVSTQPNKSVTVNFAAPIVFYLPGISYYYFTCGNNDHHVLQFGLSLNVNQPSPQQLHIDVIGTLMDSSGHSIDNSDSLVDVVVLAWTGTNPGTLLLSNTSAIANGGQSEPIPLPSASLSTLQSALSGFNLAYQTDHHVLYEGSGVSSRQNGTTGYILGQAAMGDGSGNRATTATVDGGLIAVASGVDLNVDFQVLASQQTSNQVSVSFAKNLKSAAVMIINNKAAYPGSGDHHVKTVGAGCTGWSVNGPTVLLDNARALISDGSGNHQDDSKSDVSLLVIGFYQ
jgi:hypothetical protein